MNYLDFFAGVEKGSKAMEAYIFLACLLKVEESIAKAVRPTTCLSSLGIQFDSNRMVVEVTPDRLKQILFELRDWLDRDWATKRQFQSLVGKLSFVAK